MKETGKRFKKKDGNLLTKDSTKLLKGKRPWQFKRGNTAVDPPKTSNNYQRGVARFAPTQLLFSHDLHSTLQRFNV